MYRILIVDDEAYIARGLAASMAEALDPEQHEISAVFSAREAIAALERRRIDVIVSDIEMPGMDGLELLRVTRTRWPDSRFVFLTGHSRFDYVQEALRCGCVDFVLKTEGDERLLQAVHEAMRRIEVERRERAQKAAEAREPQSPERSLAEEVIAGWLEGGPAGPHALGLALARLAPAATREGSFRCLAVSLGGEKRGDSRDRARRAALVGRLAADAFGPRTLAVPVAFDAGTGSQDLLLILQGADGIAPDSSHVKGILEPLQSGGAAPALSVPFSVAMDGKACSWAELPGRAQALLAALRDPSDPAGAFLVVPREPQSARGRSSRSDFPRLVMEYLEGNIAKDVSLTALGEHFGMNPSYFSRHFLEVSGSHLSEVVARIRYERAVRLLAGGSDLVAQIAAAVGFWTPSHFIRFFRKMSGMTPAEYRQRHQS